MPIPWLRHSKSELAVPLADLKKCMAEGWSIEPPAYRRQHPELPDGEWVCDVIMWHGHQVQVLTLREEPALRALFDELGITVDNR